MINKHYFINGKEVSEEQYREHKAKKTKNKNNNLDVMNQIKTIQSELDSLDYKAIKYAEGLYTNEEYEPVKQHRQQLRQQINALREKMQ